ncbi:hypothetical protein GCM10010317_077730 [Streptomyces mirabilis]|uniref:hypothetical protein n=1 Tax=Streptomyces mirabilis TaxID=68239 RepID=UPI0019CA9F49|nr:hypothetical protein [Streptomyces mirabilis]GHD70432.1 hypothetical protein GCM10010317_077730 [Streptomyces mirabilis]
MEAVGDLVDAEVEGGEVFDLGAADGGECVALQLQLVRLGLGFGRGVVDGGAVPGEGAVPALAAGLVAGSLAGAGGAAQFPVFEGDGVGGGGADVLEFAAGDVAESGWVDLEAFGEVCDGWPMATRARTRRTVPVASTSRVSPGAGPMGTDRMASAVRLETLEAFLMTVPTVRWASPAARATCAWFQPAAMRRSMWWRVCAALQRRRCPRW